MKFAKSSNKFLAVLLAMTLVFSSFGGFFTFAEETAEEETVIYILHTNDMHGRVEYGKYDGMGFDKVAALVNQFRAENDNVLLFDAGDVAHGMPIATVSEGALVMNVMNVMGYDAMVPGNHDFNYGSDRLLELAEMADFPILAANLDVTETGESFLEGYKIIEVAGLKIGVFGLTTPETLFKSHPKNTEGLTFVDPVASAKKMVEMLEPQTDLIVALSHLGLDESSAVNETSKGVAEQVEGIDLIVDGHSHTELPEGLLVNDTLIVQAKEYNKFVGLVKITIDAEGNATMEASLLTKDEGVALDADPEVRAAIDAEVAKQAEMLAEVVGKTSVDLQGAREYVRTGETNLGNFLADAMKWKAGADVALTNGGGIRDSVAAGDITREDLIKVAPFGNLVQAISVSGENLLAALNNGASGYPSAHGAMAHVSGITYTIDPTKPVGERVLNVMINGEKLDLEKMYSVATNDFIAAGGDKYSMFADAEVLGEYGVLDGAMIEYLEEKGTIAPQVEGRITVLPAETEEYYTIMAGDFLWKIARAHNTTWEELAMRNRLNNPHLIYAGAKLVVPVNE